MIIILLLVHLERRDIFLNFTLLPHFSELNLLYKITNTMFMGDNVFIDISCDLYRNGIRCTVLGNIQLIIIISRNTLAVTHVTLCYMYLKSWNFYTEYRETCHWVEN